MIIYIFVHLLIANYFLRNILLRIMEESIELNELNL